MKLNHILFTFFCSIATVFTAVGMGHQPRISQGLLALINPQKTSGKNFEKAFDRLGSNTMAPPAPSILPTTKKNKSPKRKTKQVKPETPKQKTKREKKEKEDRVLAAATAEVRKQRKEMEEKGATGETSATQGGGTPAASNPQSPAQRALSEKLRQLKAERQPRRPDDNLDEPDTLALTLHGGDQDDNLHGEAFVVRGMKKPTDISSNEIFEKHLKKLRKNFLKGHKSKDCPGLLELRPDLTILARSLVKLNSESGKDLPEWLFELYKKERVCCDPSRKPTPVCPTTFRILQ